MNLELGFDIHLVTSFLHANDTNDILQVLTSHVSGYLLSAAGFTHDPQVKVPHFQDHLVSLKLGTQHRVGQ